MFADALNSIFIRAYTALKREEGQTFVEYSLIGLVVAVAVAALLITFKNSIGSALTSIEGQL